jgi:hypothetical protein
MFELRPTIDKLRDKVILPAFIFGTEFREEALNRAELVEMCTKVDERLQQLLTSPELFFDQITTEMRNVNLASRFRSIWNENSFQASADYLEQLRFLYPEGEIELKRNQLLTDLNAPVPVVPGTIPASMQQADQLRWTLLDFEFALRD